MGVPWLDLKPRREAASNPLGGTVVGRFKGVDPRAEGFVLVEIGAEGNLVSVPHGGGVFPLDGPVTVQLDADGVPMGVLAGVDAEGETVALGATGKAIERQGDKLGKDIEAMDARVKAAAEGPVDTGRLTAGEVLIKGDLIAGNTIGAKHIVASEELEAKLASFRKVATDELVAGKAKINGSLIADTLEGKTIKGGVVTVNSDDGAFELRLSNSKDLGPVVGFRSHLETGGDASKGRWPMALYMGQEAAGQLEGPTLHMEGGNRGGRGVNAVSVDITPRGVQSDTGFISWGDLNALVDESKRAATKPGFTKGLEDLDRDWRREPRPHEIVREPGTDIVDLFGGEWVRQNSEWNYTGNTWFNWNLYLPVALRPKQWVHFTVVITEDNFPHFAQGVIRPDGTFGLKLDKGIRVKPNVSRIMIPPVRWRVD